jgi:hypothetical protein
VVTARILTVAAALVKGALREMDPKTAGLKV